MTAARWVVFAYHTFGARALEAVLARGERVVAVVTHTDDPAEGDWFESVVDIARTHGLPLLTPPSPNVPAVLEALAALRPDVFLSVWYRRLLGAELLALPTTAAVNLHGALLPAYRGRAPLNWMLINGERRKGVTLHHMVVEADAGDVVAQEAIDIGPDDTALELYRRIVKVGVDLLVQWYPAVLAGTAPRLPQDPAQASVYGRRRPEDGHVEWAWPAARIADMIRAVTHPFPGAFVEDRDRRLLLWAGTAEPGRATSAPPGTLLEIGPGRRVSVATGDGVLVLGIVQTPGGAEEPAAVWARRLGLGPGSRVVAS